MDVPGGTTTQAVLRGQRLVGLWVLMWELCTSAKQPYAEVDPFEMEHYLKDGYRLAQPFNCPDEL